MTKRQFITKTNDAFSLKVLAELLSANLKTGGFSITADGIKLRQWDKKCTILIDLELFYDNFTIYKFRMNEPMYAGITTQHFHKVIKSIKKKDSLVMFIRDNVPNKLYFKKIPKEHGARITTSGINIQNIQNIEAAIPTGYGKPIIIQSPEYQKMCKEISGIESQNIKVCARQCNIDFIGTTEGLIDTTVTLGDNGDEEDDENSSSESEHEVKEATFSAEHLFKIIKMSGLSTTMQIFPGNDELPYLFRSPVGTLGKISIYIKSQELIDKEKANLIDEQDDEEDVPKQPPRRADTKKSVDKNDTVKPKKSVPKKSAKIVSDNEDDDIPVVKPKKAAVVRKSTKIVSDNEDDDIPVVKPKKSTPKKSAKIVSDDEDDDIPVVKPKKSTPKKSAKIPSDDEDDDVPVVKPKKAAVVRK
jgi:hypothetical protein